MAVDVVVLSQTAFALSARCGAVVFYKSFGVLFVWQDFFLTPPPPVQYQNENMPNSQPGLLFHKILYRSDPLIGSWTFIFFFLKDHQVTASCPVVQKSHKLRTFCQRGQVFFVFVFLFFVFFLSAQISVSCFCFLFFFSQRGQVFFVCSETQPSSSNTTLHSLSLDCRVAEAICKFWLNLFFYRNLILFIKAEHTP